MDRASDVVLILTERLEAVRDRLKITGSCSVELASTPARDEVVIRLRGPISKLLRLEYQISEPEDRMSQ